MPAPPGFETERLRLRPFEPDDLPALQAILDNLDLPSTRYTPWEFSENLLTLMMGLLRKEYFACHSQLVDQLPPLV